MTTKGKAKAPVPLQVAFAKAKTSEDWQALIDRLNVEIDEADRALVALSKKRGAVLIEGGSMPAYHAELYNADQTVKTLTASLRTAEAKHQEVFEAERKAAIAAEFDRIAKTTEPALLKAWKDFHSGLEAVVAAGDAIREAELAVGNANDQARAHGLSDRVDLAGIRAKAVEAIAGHVRAPVAHVERRAGESEEQYSVRRGRAETASLDRYLQAEPIRRLADKAMADIQDVALHLDPHARAKNRRMVDVHSYVHRVTGEAAKRISDTPNSALAVPGRVQFGPYLPDGTRMEPGV